MVCGSFFDRLIYFVKFVWLVWLDFCVILRVSKIVKNVNMGKYEGIIFGIF